MIKKPVIGITLDWEDSPTYSDSHPWYALRTNYVSVVSKFNGVPITLPYDSVAIDQYIDMIDGLIVTGGDYDLSPEVYGEEIRPAETRNTRNNRTDFEISLIKAALAKNIPILGICAGDQLLVAIHGGTLLQDIIAAYPNALEHEQRFLDIHMSKTSHSIKIEADSLLCKIVGKDEMMVNSSHHQAVNSVGPRMKISAVAPDGVVEAVEMLDYAFAIGVEWHPEFLATDEDALIMQAFIKASKSKK